MNDFDKIESELLIRFGFTDDNGIDAKNQLKIFSFMDWIKHNYSIIEIKHKDNNEN